MITSKYNWELLPSFSDQAFVKATKKEGLVSLATQILYERGIQTPEALSAFLNPSLEQLHDPYLFHDMDKAVKRIRRAIEDNERILIYGDYDADGMTSASILKETLEELGAEYQVYLPNRFTDGYGPNKSVYKYFIEQQQVSLIVTVDNGVAGQEAIAYAQDMGVDVIVTDHHSLPDQLPDAYAIIHPEHPAGEYPFKYLAGCGVAFKLATALLEQIQPELLDLVAIGTIADMVSLTDENRIMVQYGLALLRQSERIGLQELLKLAGVEASQVNEETIGFQLAPRLNALGRLDDPNPAIELLTGFDEEEVADIAAMIDDKNTERKHVVQTIYEEAKVMIKPDSPVQVLAAEGWNPGVLGIVAGRLLEELQQPVIVLSIQDGLAKGSARSVEGLDIFQALNSGRELFEAFGGHSGAAGLTVKVENLESLSELLVAFIQKYQLDLTQKPTLILDEELDLADLTLETVKSLEKLAPFGMNFSKPTFYLRDFQVESARTMGQDNAHLKLRIQKDAVSVDVVAFGQGALVQEFAQVKHLELAVQLSVNQWNGNTTLQLMLVDARVQGVQLFDIRAKHHPLPEAVPILAPKVESASVVLLDIPDNPQELQTLFAHQDFEAIYFKNQIKKEYYLTGYGSREQFAKFYKAIYQFPEFDVRYKLKELADYLKIPYILLIKMVQIFQELDFVTITDGVMTVNKEAQKREITESQIYQDLKKTVQFQELMALGTPEEIYDWLTK
ncbi:single-stranded-DNA-specific exonuclease RecJ [Streptococcus minor]|uniref:Single-stranded-DNA-specific exonuclease RecJ n=1 Tax=Streptococcus minor TaxID=229549 RepID=A0A3P1V9N1_9STRE|nr:single-stranded-DNA-specific exonuclease RecJ [Streptococcus minor]RRD30468.1 single-stranded-DNA-specific exonuclease RecJ [Streptococcus minor]